MTSMHSGGYGQFPIDDMPLEERVSVLAILSLVMGLICFIPGLGVLGAICGIAALLFIGSSGGRLSGRGLAIAGIILGLLFTMVWVGLAVGTMSIMNTMGTQMVMPAETLVRHIDNREYDQVRASLTGDAATKLTDADIEAFRTAYTDTLGGFVSGPSGFINYIQQFSTMGQEMQQFQGRANTIPIPMTFAKGQAVLGLVIDTNATPANNNNTLPIKNIGLFTGGREILLYNPEARPLPPADGQPAPAENP